MVKEEKNIGCGISNVDRRDIFLERRIPFFTICILLIFILGIFLFLYSFNNTKLELQRDYYKDQMLSFCELTKNYQQNSSPCMYPCERWEIPK